MELFKRNPFVRTDRVENNPLITPVETVETETDHTNWPMLAALTVAAMAFAILVAVGAIWIYNKVHKPAPAPNSTQSLPAPPPQNLTPGQ